MNHVKMLAPSNDLDVLPEHIAIIMDGNGRWAQKRQKVRINGHRAGVKAVLRVINAVMKYQIPTLTLFAFSSENWSRPQAEVMALMKLFSYVLRHYINRLNEHHIRLQIIGNRQGFSSTLQDQITNAERLTANNTGMQLNIAANYGGQWDIVQAAQKLVQAVHEQGLQAKQVTPEKFASYLSLKNLANVDLLIRTGGEKRISNFLLWEVAYAELYFTDVLWPDVDEKTIDAALKDFGQRQRRFGGTSEYIRDKNNNLVAQKEVLFC